jgi:hypothetical protein
VKKHEQQGAQDPRLGQNKEFVKVRASLLALICTVRVEMRSAQPQRDVV